MTKSILITGHGGFIGSNYYRFVSQKSPSGIITPRHDELDILDRETLKRFFASYRPDVMINFAAFRNANVAERERGDSSGLAWRTNVVGVDNISRICEEYGTFLIHISTDMVFSGTAADKGPYSETTKPETNMDYLSWYGWTKAEAERTLSENTNVAIIRIGNVTQPIYDPALDYVGKIIYLFDRGELYPLFDDQYITLTSIPFVCQVIDVLVRKKRPGIYHVASRDTFTPYELGTYLIKKMHRKDRAIKRMSITSYLATLPHRYPQYGGLLAHDTEKQLGIAMPSWREIVNASIDSFHQ